MHFDNPLDVTFLEVGEGGVIAKQKGHSGIVILKVKALAHPRRCLVDKAEDAGVFAAHLTVHQIGFKLQSQIVVLVFFHHDCAQLFFLITQQDFQMLVGHIKPVIEHIGDCVSVDADQGISLVYPCPSCRTARFNAGDSDCHPHRLLSAWFAA